jgi:hypothetical protein
MVTESLSGHGCPDNFGPIGPLVTVYRVTGVPMIGSPVTPYLCNYKFNTYVGAA